MIECLIRGQYIGNAPGSNQSFIHSFILTSIKEKAILRHGITIQFVCVLNLF
jgi:hypothetical protein